MYASEPRGSYPEKFFLETLGLTDPKGFGMERIYFENYIATVVKRLSQTIQSMSLN